MANKLMRTLGFGAYDSMSLGAGQLSISTPSYSTYSTPAAYSTPAPSSSDEDTGGVWADVASTAIGVAGQVATSVWGQHPAVSQTPAYSRAGVPAGSVAGSIDSKILLLGGIAVLGIIMMMATKKS
ncbi:MAG: hypothetical protein EPO08_21055 [Rhodospirillaceae bacterium]|nr:MAG: hypothetical protein EPO08_21055 [Rhodospirillaceae bacterium]